MRGPLYIKISLRVVELLKTQAPSLLPPAPGLTGTGRERDPEMKVCEQPDLSLAEQLVLASRGAALAIQMLTSKEPLESQLQASGEILKELRLCCTSSIEMVLRTMPAVCPRGLGSQKPNSVPRSRADMTLSTRTGFLFKQPCSFSSSVPSSWTQSYGLCQSHGCSPLLGRGDKAPDIQGWSHP